MYQTLVFSLNPYFCTFLCLLKHYVEHYGNWTFFFNRPTVTKTQKTMDRSVWSACVTYATRWFCPAVTSVCATPARIHCATRPTTVPSAGHLSVPCYRSERCKKPHHSCRRYLRRSVVITLLDVVRYHQNQLLFIIEDHTLNVALKYLTIFRIYSNRKSLMPPKTGNAKLLTPY